MYIILGATGHVGSAVAKNLLQANQPVTIITHDEAKRAEWEALGATVAVVDIYDTEKLLEVFNTGTRLFLLHPPAPISTDTVTEEKKTLTSILTALEGSSIEKVVAESTYGAREGEGIGDSGILYHMEEQLKRIGIPHSIIRAAYYMSNWDMSIESAQKEGKVYSFYPPNFSLPMVAPADLGKVAARLLQESVAQTGLHWVEGPKQYTINDVAIAFSAAIGKPVAAVQIPKDKWLTTMQQDMGFSEPAAKSMAAMTELTIQDLATPDNPVRGEITLEEYIKEVVEGSKS